MTNYAHDGEQANKAYRVAAAAADALRIHHGLVLGARLRRLLSVAATHGVFALCFARERSGDDSLDEQSTSTEPVLPKVNLLTTAGI